MSVKITMTMEEAEAIMFDADGLGYCLECGEEAWGVEPDAHGYECETCGAMAVSGAEECIITNAITII